MTDEEKKIIKNCDFIEFVNAVEKIENNETEQDIKPEIAEDVFAAEKDDWEKINFSKIPHQNYHILGYITFLYLLYVIIISWDSKINYGFYELLRWLITCFSAWTSVRIYNKNPQSVWLLIFSAITILFNPIVKIALDKDVWQIIDLITAIIYIVYAIKNKPCKN